MSLRRLWVLVSRLPPGGALDHARRGEAAEWGVAEGLLARVGNLILQTNVEKLTDSDLVKPPRPRPRRG